MKTLIFADSHLSAKFNQAKFEKLTSIIKQVDKTIINGDFWDGYLTNFKSFINSKWQKLFSLLKSKNTTYIYGNHDKKEFLTNETRLFSNEVTERKVLQTKKYKITVEHGHRINPSSEMLYPKILAHKIPVIIGKYIEYRGYELVKEYIRRKTHKVILKYAQNHYKDNNILICGHSHYQYADINRYYNPGIFNYNRAEYMIIENDKFKLFNERY